MVDKIAGLARALALFLALVAGFVETGGLHIALIIVVFGLIAGLLYDDNSTPRLLLTVLVMPAIGAALNHIPGIGAQLGAVAGNVGLAAAAAAATVIAIRCANMVKDGVVGLNK